MIYNLNESTRRILTFPAVKPSESISITTLFNSLLSISKQISNLNESQFLFTSNKRNAKNALRFIQALRVFLEGVRDEGGFDKVGKYVISPLLDLHVALQKVNFLFEDWTRQDARVWMLMNAELVSGHFRALIGSVGASLDHVLPLLRCDDEVQELGLLLIHQGKRAQFEVQMEDIWASNLVKFALGRFESRVIPNSSELRRVLSYLGIKKWVDCNNQVKFLEEETGSGSVPAASLMGLMMYCRCVLFDRIDCDYKRALGKKYSYNSGYLNPDDIKCPISLEIMVDPVTISTGQTYDRVNIVKWFKAGNMVCPKTGQKIQTIDLVPNLAIKEVIKQYCLENGVLYPIPKYMGSSKRRNNVIQVVDNLVVQEATRMVADFLSLKLAMGTMGEKSKAAYEIRLLTKRSMFNRACFMESRAISYLLNLLFSKDSVAQENSMAALLNLSKHPENKPVIVDNGGLSMIIRVLKSGIKMEARYHAAGTLFYLSSVEEYRGVIGNNPDAIPSLVELVRVGGDQGRKNALVALFSLLLLPSNHCKVLEAKLVSILVSLLGSVETSEDVIVDSLALLAALAEKPDGARAILHAKALDVITRMLCSPSLDSSRIGREHLVSLLLTMCINCRGEVVDVLVKNTFLMRALYSLLVEGTSRASKKASSLISILHEHSERRSVHPMPRASPHENFINVW